MLNEADLEIAHVLLIDVVGYAKLLVEAQMEVMHHLNRLVRDCAAFRSAETRDKLIRLPTGDGMALIFLDSPQSPVQCAIEIGQAMAQHSEFAIRMGAHSGPIKKVNDVNDRENFAGSGINIAQRVLDCGDGGHILVSQRLAEDLSPYRHWHSSLHDLGECEVKHGLRLRIFNLCHEGTGNPEVPARIKQQHRLLHRGGNLWRTWAGHSPLRKAALLLAGLLPLLLLVIGGWIYLRSPLPEDRTIAVLPFGSSSPEPENVSFAYGIHDEIQKSLRSVAALRVTDTTSVLPYTPETRPDLPAIAKSLGVAYILEGTVTRSKSRLRVHIVLTDVRRNLALPHDYTASSTAPIIIPTDITRDIAWKLHLRLSAADEAAMAAANPLVYNDQYVRARILIDHSVFSQHAQSDLTEAVQVLQEVVSQNPQFAEAYYQLAHACDQLYSRFEQTPKRLKDAEDAIAELVSLQPDAGETHLAIAKNLYWGHRDYDGARRELTVAAKLLPNESLVPLLLGYIDRREGKWDSSAQNLQRAQALDPRNPVVLQQSALSFFLLHRYAKAGAALDEAISVAKEDVNMRLRRAVVELEWKADTKPMHNLIRSILRENPGPASLIADDQLYLALCERDEKAADDALRSLDSEGCHSESVPFPRSWCEGLTARTFQHEDAARTFFAQTLREAQDLVRDQPDNAGALCVLGLAHAALGHKNEAIAAGQRATASVQTSEDAIDGARFAECLACIYSFVGDKVAACAQLKTVTAQPSFLSYGNLKLHPYWDPLRGDPGFEDLVASLAPR